MHLALTGGVGGAKLVLGLARQLDPGALNVVVNTGDDFDHLGLRICPDIDTVMYTLAGLANRRTGWGLADESWNFMAAIYLLGGEDWFRLGDGDLATHVERTRRLTAGEPLSAITAEFCSRLGVRHAVIPMSDDPVGTRIKSKGRTIDFQEYLVRLGAEPPVEGFCYAGIERARPSAAFDAALNSPHLRSIILCNSNPFVSILPILELPGIRERLMRRRVPVIAVSPIVGGSAVRGPLAKMLSELGKEPSPVTIAKLYGDLLDGFVMDRKDDAHIAAITTLGITPVVTRTVMRTDNDKVSLAAEILALAEMLSAARSGRT